MTRLALIVAIALLAACSSQPVDPKRYYLLRAPLPAGSGEQAAASQYWLANVEVATYIDQSGLVQELGNGEIHMARHHQWAEPLRTSLPRFLANGIGAEAGESIALVAGREELTRIDVTIDQLHGNSRGDAVLVAYWRVQAPGEEARSYHFSGTEALDRDGFAALAAAEESLLGELARRIGQSL